MFWNVFRCWFRIKIQSIYRTRSNFDVHGSRWLYNLISTLVRPIQSLHLKVWKKNLFFFFFASALEMASQCPVVGQLNQRFFKVASLTSIITIFTWYIVFPDKFYLFLDLRKYIPSFTIRQFFKIQRILEFFVWEWFDAVRYENYLQPFHYENVGKVPWMADL